MISKSLCLLLIGFVAVECKPFFSYYNQTNANQFIDGTLDGIKTKYKDMLDPFHVPDHTFEFHEKIVVDWHGSAHLTEGVVTGLSHINRSGDSTVGTEDGHLEAHLQLGDNNIKVHFKVDAEFMGIHDKLTLESSVGNIDVKTKIAVGKDGKPQILTLDMDELKHVKIDIRGQVQIVDKLIDLLGEGFVKVFNPTARNLISSLLKDVLNKELQTLKFPPTL